MSTIKNAATTAILLIVLFAACQKDPGGPSIIDPPDEQDTTLLGMKINTMSVLRNGKAWKVDNLTVIRGEEDSLQVYIGKASTSSGLTEKFNIYGVPSIKGQHPVINEIFAYWTGRPYFSMGWSYDGDQFLGFTRADTLYPDNHFEILRFDPAKRILEGKFEVKLVGDLVNYPAFWDPEKIISDTILLTEGKFVVQVPE